MKTFDEWWAEFHPVCSAVSYKVTAEAAWNARQAEIDALKAKLQIAVEALEYHTEMTRPIQKTIDALAKIKETS